MKKKNSDHLRIYFNSPMLVSKERIIDTLQILINTYSLLTNSAIVARIKYPLNLKREL